MANVSVYNMDGQEVGTMELSDEIFGVEVKENLVHQAVVLHLANMRQGTQKAKTRSEVSGGGIKPWRQKGTGHARQGSTRSPQWRHGGVVFAPVPRSYTFKMNKKERRAALKSALTSKLAENNLIVVDKLTFDDIKTKNMVKVTKALDAENAYVVLQGADKNVFLSTFEDSKKSAYKLLFSQAIDGETKAKDIYDGLLSAGIIAESTHAQLMNRIPAIKAIYAVLGDCEEHSRTSITSEGECPNFSRYIVYSALDDLVKFDLIELQGLGYILKGAKERREREARQKAAYDEACAVVNRQIQEEIDLRVGRMSEEYDPRLNGIQREINEEISEFNRQRESIERQISDLNLLFIFDFFTNFILSLI